MGYESSYHVIVHGLSVDLPSNRSNHLARLERLGEPNVALASRSGNLIWHHPHLQCRVWILAAGK